MISPSKYVVRSGYFCGLSKQWHCRETQHQDIRTVSRAILYAYSLLSARVSSSSHSACCSQSQHATEGHRTGVTLGGTEVTVYSNLPEQKRPLCSCSLCSAGVLWIESLLEVWRKGIHSASRHHYKQRGLKHQPPFCSRLLQKFQSDSKKTQQGATNLKVRQKWRTSLRS